MADPRLQLRCALVWERTLLEERVFGPGVSVTVGESPRATFTLQANGLGKRQLVLRPDGDGAMLRLRPGMLGRVNIAGRPLEVEELAADSSGLARRHGDALEYRLAAGDGGVLVFGRVGLVFDFVEAVGPIPPAGLGQVLDSDPTINRVFAGGLGLVLMLVLVSKLFAAPAAEFTVEQLPDRFVSFVTEDPEEAKALKQELEKRREQKRLERKRRPENKPAANKPARERRLAARERPEDRQTREIREKVVREGVLGAVAQARKKDRALSQVLEEGGLAMNLNDALGALDRGAQARVIASTGGSGPMLPSMVQRRGAASALGEGLTGDAPRTGRTARRAAGRSRLSGRSEARVRLQMPAGAARVTGGTLSKQAIAKVVRDNKGAISYCYESQLNRFPTLRGKITVDFIIEPDGGVKTVRVPTNQLSNQTAGRSVASCLMRMIRRWQFPKPQGGKVRVIYPFTFGRTR